MLGIANRRIETSDTPRRGDGIPQRNARALQRRQPICVVERRKVASDCLSGKVPEPVLRMRVIASRRERCLARQAAEDENPRAGIGDRGECGLADQKAVPSP